MTGGAQLEIDLPLHFDLGPITLPTLYLVGGFGASGLTLEVSAALGVELGPIQASVDRVGALGTLSFPNGGGNLGPAELQSAIQAAERARAGHRRGSGRRRRIHLLRQRTRRQYAGVFGCRLVDVIQVNIIGLLDTIMPDGSSGFSFLLIITFGFPPIQLGFGFTLDTVGGIGGVNRTMSTDALHAGFMAHTLGNVICARRSDRQRAADHQRPSEFFPGRSWALPIWADRGSGMGYADADCAYARRDSGSSRSDPARDYSA